MNFNYIFILIIICFFILLTYSSNQSNKNKEPYFVLLTDFGNDFAVGSIRGIILSKIPDAKIIDLDHTIDKFNIISASFVLSKSYKYFPKGTIFICVVDPGVGTKRESLCIKTSDYTFIGPNNGIFDFVLEQEKNRTIYKIDESFYLKGKSNTFHGRDLFAPAAIDFYKSNLYSFIKFDESKLIHIKESNQTIATYIDSFGNIKTNKLINANSKLLTIKINNKQYSIPFVKTFKDVPKGNLLCYLGSNNTLELAVNEGSAAEELQINVGNIIMIENIN